MASNINDTGVNADFPVAGQDNDSQGFRDNFSIVKSNFVAAKAEIESLQNNTAQGVSYNSETGSNDFLGTDVRGANFINNTEASYEGGSVQSSQNINLSSGFYQTFTVSADITLTLSSWSADTGKTGRVRVFIKADIGATRTITFGSNAGGGTIKTGPNWPTSDNTAVIVGKTLSQDADKVYVFEFISFDSGDTVYAEYLGLYE